MGNAIHQVRASVVEMIAATKRVLGPVASHSRSSGVTPYPQARWVLESLERMLETHVCELVEHLQRLGGTVPAANGSVEPSKAQPLANALRDDYAALSLAHAGALMLETNARALGYSSTAALARRHREEMATMLARLREQVVPGSVKGEVDGLNAAV